MATSSPRLTLPATETAVAGGTVSVAGIDYADDFAAGNPGVMYLRISDNSGTLSAVNAAGVVVAGSGSNSITLNVTYADVTAVSASLTYTAAATTGADAISFDLWDQSGIETSGTVPVTIGAAGAADTWIGSISSDWNNGGNWSSGVVPGSGATVTIPGGTPNPASLSGATLSGEAITLAAGGGTGPTVNFTDVTLGVGTVLTDTVANTLPAATLQLGGTFTIGAGASLADPSGLMLLHTAPGAAPAVVVNHGSINGDGGHLNIDTGGSVVNDGYIIASAGGGVGFDLALHPGMAPPETILNAGTLEVANGTLFINGTVDGGTVLFSGAGGLVLEQPNGLTNGAAIVGFGPNDTITIDQVPVDSLSFANGTLTLTQAGVVAEALPMRGDYTTANFAMAFQPSNQASWVISYVPTTPPRPTGPQVNVPAAEQVVAGGTVAVGGVSVVDAFAASNPGMMALNVTDNTGAVSMTDSGGTAIAGSGTAAIHYAGTLAQIDAALASLQYTAATSAGRDSITVDVWDQAGLETARAIAVSVTDGTVAALTSTSINSTTGTGMTFIGSSSAMSIAAAGSDTTPMIDSAAVRPADLIGIVGTPPMVGPSPDVTPPFGTTDPLLTLPQHAIILPT